MAVDLEGIFGRKPLSAMILIFSNQFFLLGVNGHDRRSCGQRTLRLCIDVAELCVPVGMIVAFFRLAVALQAVVLIMKQLCNFFVTDRMVLSRQLCGQCPSALAYPAQRGFRIPMRFRFYQAIQCIP